MNERMQILATVGVLALAALLLFAGSAVAGDPPDAAALQTASSWSSGWVDIATDTAQTFTHDLGGDPDDYAVELWFRDTAPDGKGINSWGIGGFEAGGNFRGAHWQNLTDTTIEVVRRKDDTFADQVRVRIWVREYKVFLPLVLKAYSEMSFSYEASDCLGSSGRADGDQVEIWVEGHDIVMEHRGATYNCCATMVVDLIDQRPLLQLIERETYPQGGPCDCLCPYDLSARIANLPPGTYHVEVWDESKTHLFGSAWVTVE